MVRWVEKEYGYVTLVDALAVVAVRCELAESRLTYIYVAGK